MELKNINNKNDKKKVKSVNTTFIKIYKDVLVEVENNNLINFKNFKTLNDLLNNKFDIKIISIKPPLYKNFIKDNKINININIGDIVESKQHKIERQKIINLHLKSLSDMSVIIATLEDKTIWLSTDLKIIK